ncbi:MAG: type II toxin-antitoxin system VapC family toxin [Reyranella sp.]|nr:type II toxin-antitoxin system VapC family toxin [Reyranella sp.]
MTLLLDSHVLIWLLGRPEYLSPPARQALSDPDNQRFVSIASLWEIAIKVSVGKLAFPAQLDEAIEHSASTLLPVSVAHAGRLLGLPFHHRDPFDRMLVAQAMEEGLTIVTRDRRFTAYGVPILAA